MRSCSSTNTPLLRPVCAPADPLSLSYCSPISCEDFTASNILSGITHLDDNHSHPWWGLPCTVTPCFGARLVQESNQSHYPVDRVDIGGRFRDADAYHPDQVPPLLIRQLELIPTDGELSPRHQHAVTLYARGLTCEADTLGSCDYVYLAFYPTSETKKWLSRMTFCSGLVSSPHHLSIFISVYQENPQYENIA